MAKFKVLAIALNMQYIIVRTKKQKQFNIQIQVKLPVKSLEVK